MLLSDVIPHRRLLVFLNTAGIGMYRRHNRAELPRVMTHCTIFCSTDEIHSRQDYQIANECNSSVGPNKDLQCKSLSFVVIAFDEGERCLFTWFLPAGLIMSRGYRSRCQSISGFGRHLGLAHLASIPFGLAHVASIPCVT